MTDTPTPPAMTPEQRAATVYNLRYGNLHDIDPDNLADQLEAERDAAQAGIARLTAALATAREGGMREAAQVAIGRKGFGSDAALVHPYDKGYVAACDAMATAIRALATPDQIAALAASPDTITLPRAEVEALMEAAEITLAAIMRLQDEWGDYDPEGVHWNRITAFAATYAEGDEHDAVRMRKALTALRERMK